MPNIHGAILGLGYCLFQEAPWTLAALGLLPTPTVFRLSHSFLDLPYLIHAGR